MIKRLCQLSKCHKNVPFLFYFYCLIYKQDIRPYTKPSTPEIVSTPVNNLSLPMSSNPSSPNVWSKNNTQITKNKLQFTMKREYDKAREEAELVKQLRNVSVRIISLIVQPYIKNNLLYFRLLNHA